MTTLALALVLISALIHATWNLLAKRANSGPVFVWLLSTIAAACYVPAALAILVTRAPRIGLAELIVITGGAALQVAYFIFLSRGYRAADLSLVYPLARGTGPLLATLGAVAFLGERPTPLACAGTGLIGVGVFALTGDPRKLRDSGALRGVIHALLTGVTIATYTMWDNNSVARLMIPPMFYMWALLVGQSVLLLPYALRHWDAVRQVWHDQRREAVGVALLSPLAYTLVLTALVFSPVSYIAPAREISVLIGAVMGTRLLSEVHAPRRLGGATAMMLGIVALALG